MDSISPPNRPHYPWKQGEILIADELNAAIANAGHGTRVTDWIPGGQPDGVTDLAVYFQAAIDDAADADPADRASAPGLTRLIVPANPLPYIIGTSLYIPSNSHIVIEHGATLKLAPQTNAHMFLLVCFAHHVLIELYGTLDGNSSQQSFMPNPDYPATSVNPTTICGGISTDRLGGTQGTIPVQGGFCNHIRIIGDRNGLVTNFQNGPIGIGTGTNCEVSGISMTNSAFRAGSIGMGGWRNFPFDPGTNTLIAFTGTYVAATNIVTLTTNHPHRMIPGEEFITEQVTGSSGTYNCATGKLLITLPGTAGNTIVYSGTGGGTDAVITGGRITNWFYQQATIVTGTYVPATGVITVTTTAPHQLVYGQMISSNITGGMAAAVATGIFELLDVTQGQSQPPLTAAKNVTLRYRAVRSGTVENIIAPSGYDIPSGIVTLTTDAPHGLSPGDVVTVLASGSGFLSPSNSEQICITGTTGTTIKYQVPPNIVNKPIVISGGTVVGGPTQTITGGTIGVSTKMWNSGFDNCFMDQIRDIGPCIYGGGVSCYIRRSEITRNLGTGPFIYSDLNSGRSVNCEISGNYIHDNYGVGVGTALNNTTQLIPHVGTRIFDNYITGNYGGAGFSMCDGLDCTNNRFYANRVQALNVYGSVGEIAVGPHADHVKIVGNSLRDPCVLSTPPLGSAVLQIASGTYDNVTGAVVLNMVPTLRSNQAIYTNAYFTLSGVTGTGAYASLEGRYIVEQALHYTIIKFHAPAGLGVSTITGGQVTPNGFGIVVHSANYLLVADNFIGDYQATKTMLAAIGGTWGPGGICTGNYYGPRINTGGVGANFPADMSVGAKEGNNFDTVTGFIDGTTLRQPFSSDVNERFAPLGIQVGYNRSGGRGESNIYVGAANANPGGFDFIKIIGLKLSTTTPGYVSTIATVAASGNTYNNVTGSVTLTTTTAHGMAVGNLVGLSGVTGTVTSPDGTAGNIADFNGTWTITAVTGTTLTFIALPDEGTVTITGGTVGTAIVTLATTTPHGLVVGSRFNLSLVLGTTVALGGPTNLGDIQALDGNWIATGDGTGTSGTTINFNLLHQVAGIGLMPNTGLDIIAINGGAINASEMDSGIIDTSVGLPVVVSNSGTLGFTTGGSLLAVDGYANTRLSGALVHGAIQTATLVNGGTVTVPQNTSFILVNNSSSVATGSLVLPAPQASSYQTIGSELTVRFQNPVGTLTVTAATGAAVAGPPTTVLSAGASFRFIQGGPSAANTWLPCLPDVSGTPPVGGPYLPLSGGMVSPGPLTLNASQTITAGGIVGLNSTTRNTGSNTGNAVRFLYFSGASTAGAFDIGLTSLAIYDPGSFASPATTYLGMWAVCVSPNDATHNWACNGIEFDVVNRGPDPGWSRDRTSARATGGVLIVPEVGTFGGTGGGEGKNANFGLTVSHSGGNNSTGFPAKFYNCMQIEPNSAVGLTGRGIYATGDITGTASQYPYGPMQLDGTWLHGIDHTLATYGDGRAQTMAVGQALGWIVGPTTAPTAIATISGSGSGGNASLSLAPFGSGTVTVSAGSFLVTSGQVFAGAAAATSANLYMQAAIASTRNINWYSGASLRWRFGPTTVAESGSNVGCDLAIATFDDSGNPLVNPAVLITRSTGQTTFAGAVRHNGTVGFNNTAPIAKPTGWGTSTGGARAAITGSSTLPQVAAAVAQILNDLTAYGLIGV